MKELALGGDITNHSAWLGIIAYLAEIGFSKRVKSKYRNRYRYSLTLFVILRVTPHWQAEVWAPPKVGMEMENSFQRLQTEWQGHNTLRLFMHTPTAYLAYLGNNVGKGPHTQGEMLEES